VGDRDEYAEEAVGATEDAPHVLGPVMWLVCAASAVGANGCATECDTDGENVAASVSDAVTATELPEDACTAPYRCTAAAAAGAGAVVVVVAVAARPYCDRQRSLLVSLRHVAPLPSWWRLWESLGVSACGGVAAAAGAAAAGGGGRLGAALPVTDEGDGDGGGPGT